MSKPIKWTLDYSLEKANKILRIVKDRAKAEDNCTIPQIAAQVGISKGILNKYIYDSEYEEVKKIAELIKTNLEANIHTIGFKKNSVFAMFILKTCYGYKENNETESKNETTIIFKRHE